MQIFYVFFIFFLHFSQNKTFFAQNRTLFVLYFRSPLSKKEHARVSPYVTLHPFAGE